MGTKQEVIKALYARCQASNDFVFDNNLVKEVCRELSFGNPFDVTKIDNSALLPEELQAEDVFIVPLGTPRGSRAAQHQFVRGISEGYHQFEAVPDSALVTWPYRRSILNNINTSESNILSMAYNQRIIHDFLYEDLAASPKVYGSHRTQTALSYYLGGAEIRAHRVQGEIDFTAEHLGRVTIFEAKNGEPPDFNGLQLFNPYRYYRNVAEANGIAMQSVQCCYLLRQGHRLRLYLYSFDDPERPGSLRLERNAEYNLVLR